MQHSFLMKSFLVLFVAISALATAGISAGQTVDKTEPPVLYGFKSLSETDLNDGTLLLFDGITFFGWEAVMTPGNSAPATAPSIVIANGEMTVKSEVPLRIQTPLFWSTGDAGQSVEVIWAGKDLSLSCELAKNGTVIESKKFSYQPEGRKRLWTRSIFSVNKKDIPSETSFSLLFEKGEYRVLEIRLHSPGNKKLEFKADSNSWNPPADDMKIDTTAPEGVCRLANKGRLESKEEFGNFLLRTAFKTEVDPVKKAETYCNSGVFFRSLPNSKLDGYECQVNNAPQVPDRSKFLGNDTGSIFRRVAARRVTDRDNEWTHLALSADGLVFRTWVNGIPVVVWKDDRAADPNPRRGARLEKGTIQLQGHDPWTKIQYRPFSLAE